MLSFWNLDLCWCQCKLKNNYKLQFFNISWFRKEYKDLKLGTNLLQQVLFMELTYSLIFNEPFLLMDKNTKIPQKKLQKTRKFTQSSFVLTKVLLAMVVACLKT